MTATAPLLLQLLLQSLHLRLLLLQRGQSIGRAALRALYLEVQSEQSGAVVLVLLLEVIDASLFGQGDDLQPFHCDEGGEG